MELKMVLFLPRDAASVPLSRQVLTNCLETLGVTQDTRTDIALALSEACGNVIEHSGPGDAYEVLVTIGPALAEIRVVDVGRGFDHASLSTRAPDGGEERGRGIRLMHALVDQVRLESAPERGTMVHLVKRLTFDDSSPARRLMLSSGGEEAGPQPERA